MDFDIFLSTYGYEGIRDNLDYENEIIYPEYKNIFRAFELTPSHSVKVVIFGQDPYHTKGCANGLAFSVSKNVKMPPSLRNIFKELKSDLNIDRKDTNLSDWAKQGVLLLNTALSVNEGEARSHTKIWKNLAKDVIEVLNQKESPIIFLLWGNDARKNKPLIDKKHYVLESAHPSPLSAYNGFFDSKPFSKTNDILAKLNEKAIDW